MSEETVTMTLVEWLKSKSWKVIAFDYPGSGTGVRLHKNGTRYKNKDTSIPDIIAVKEGVALFFENKDHFCYKDFQKQYSNINEGLYSDDVKTLLRPYGVHRVLWGIGIPESKYTENVKKKEGMVDFLLTVEVTLEVNERKLISS